MDFAPVTFRLGYGRWLAVATAAVALSGIVGLVVAGDPVAVARFCWPLLLVALSAFALFWRPALVVKEHRVTVRNVFRTVELSWPAIERIDTKYALTLFTTAGTISVWAAPAPGRHAGSTATLGGVGHLPRRMLGPGGSIRPGDLPTSESGAAAFVLRQRYDELLEAGHLAGGVEPGSVVVHWHAALIVAMVTLAVASVVGFAIG